MSEKQQELIEFTESKGWSTKMWDAAIELEAYTRLKKNWENDKFQKIYRYSW